jgi:hypothetical protein
MGFKLCHGAREYDLAKHITVGRQPTMDIILTDGMVSGKHGFFAGMCCTIVTLLSHCCCTVVTLLLHCCYTVLTLL